MPLHTSNTEFQREPIHNVCVTRFRLPICSFPIRCRIRSLSAIGIQCCRVADGHPDLSIPLIRDGRLTRSLRNLLESFRKAKRSLRKNAFRKNGLRKHRKPRSIWNLEGSDFESSDSKAANSKAANSKASSEEKNLLRRNLLQKSAHLKLTSLIPVVCRQTSGRPNGDESFIERNWFFSVYKLLKSSKSLPWALERTSRLVFQ